MDSRRDFDAFGGMMDQLCAAWNRPVSDDVVKSYWSALKDVPLPEVERNVARIIKTATRRDPWPKPGDLRDEAPTDVKQDPKFDEGVARAVRNLEMLKRENEEAWRGEAALRRLDRIIATEWEGSPAYAQALREWRQARGIHVGRNE